MRLSTKTATTRAARAARAVTTKAATTRTVPLTLPGIGASLSTKKKEPSVTLVTIPDDVLVVLYKNLNISQLINMYYLNKSFSTKKGAMIDVETLDLTDIKIDIFIIKFIDDNIDKLKIKKIILDNISFANDDIFNKFILSIRLRHLENHYKNVEELVISNFDALEGKYIDPDVETINYFLTLIENIGFFSNLKKLTISHTDIIVQLDWDINGRFAFTETFVTMLEYLENLQHLIFDYNNIEPSDLRQITKGVRKINKNRRKMKIPEIKPYERSHNNTIIM